MSLQIPDNLNLPQEILEAHNQGKLALFLGAGLSASMGCVNWGTLTSNLVARCLQLGFINYAEKRYYDDLKDNIQVISACFNKFKQHSALNEYYGTVIASCQVNQELAKGFCMELKSLASFYLTTNYDDGFDKYFLTQDIIYRHEDFEKLGITGNSIESGKLYHIHGSIMDPPSMVLTEADYAKKYGINGMNFMSFLKKVFQDHSILFIGYGLQENVIRYAVNNAMQVRDNTHFILKDYFSDETTKYNQELEYLGASGIQVVSYLKDVENYQKMINIIKSWSSQLTKTEISMI